MNYTKKLIVRMQVLLRSNLNSSGWSGLTYDSLYENEETLSAYKLSELYPKSCFVLSGGYNNFYNNKQIPFYDMISRMKYPLLPSYSSDFSVLPQDVLRLIALNLFKLENNL